MRIKKLNKIFVVFEFLFYSYFLCIMFLHSVHDEVDFWGLIKATSTQHNLLIYYSATAVALLLLYLICKVGYRGGKILTLKKIKVMDIIEIISIVLLLVAWKIDLNLIIFSTRNIGGALLFSFEYKLLIGIALGLTIQVAIKLFRVW